MLPFPQVADLPWEVDTDRDFPKIEIKLLALGCQIAHFTTIRSFPTVDPVVSEVNEWCFDEKGGDVPVAVSEYIKFKVSEVCEPTARSKKFHDVS